MHATPAQEITLAHVDGIAVRTTGLDIETHWHDALMADPARTAALAKTSRVCIVLEHICGTFDAAVLRLHLKAPEPPSGGDPGQDIYLGAVALYGLRLASLPTPDGGAGGLTSLLDVTRQARERVAMAFETRTPLSLSIRPAQPLSASVEISIARIRIYLDNLGALPPPA